MLGRWFCLLGTALCALAGCGEVADKAPPRVLSDNAPDQDAEAAPVDMPAPPTRSAQRRACNFMTGDMASDTLDPDDPTGDQIPIDHFIVIMQENRSFDHYFEMLPERGQADADVAPKAFSNPAAMVSATDQRANPKVGIYHETAYCKSDIEHGWNGVHEQYAGGKMNGFVASSDGGTSVMGYYDESDLPYYYALARSFAIGDRYFSDVMGPTYPNRAYAVAGSSFGVVADSALPSQAEQQTIFHRLLAAGLDFRIYAEKETFEEKMFPDLRSEPGDHFGTIDRFMTDAMNGDLPELSWIESALVKSAKSDDEHPPADVQLGERFVSQVIGAVMQSSLWASSALFLTYDEHGGFFDHVPPPRACPPDAIEPMLPLGGTPGRFDHYGFRVPFIAVSPYAKPNYVSHRVLSHASILRLIEARFGLPAGSARSANAEPPLDLFDFSQAAFAVPPALPDAAIDAAELSRCTQAFP